MHDQKKKPENKGKESKSFSELTRKTRRKGIGASLMVSGLMGAGSDEKPSTSIAQKLVENNALVKTEDWVKSEDVLDVIENNNSGDFKIIRDEKWGSPKVVMTTETKEGYKVEFELDITGTQHGRKVSEILEDLGVSEDFIGRVQLIEMSHDISVAIDEPGLEEKTITLMVDGPKFRKSELDFISDELRMVRQVFYVPARQRAYEAVMRDPSYLSDPADLIKDDVF